MSGEFIERHRLVATSSVRSALEVLLDKDLVYRTETGYVVYDRLFGEWLRARACWQDASRQRGYASTPGRVVMARSIIS